MSAQLEEVAVQPAGVQVVAKSKGEFHIPSLDGLRALSFALVFAAHAGLDHIVPGGFGVTVFFFLSGFLITTLMRREFDKRGTVSLKNFYVRRALRILPPFYSVLLVASLLTLVGVLPGKLEASAVLAQALHYANFWMIHVGADGFAAGTAVYWSLAVEEHFYLLFPLLFLLLNRLGATRKTQALVLFGLCALILVWRIVLVQVMGSESIRTYIGSDTRFDSILFGCALAIYGNPMLDAPTTSDRLWKYLLLPLGIAGLLASFLIRGPVFRETLRYSLQGVSLLPVFVCAMRFPEWAPMRLLNLKPLAFVGVLSYSLYLIHQVALFALTSVIAAPVPRALLALLIALALAWLMREVVEKPCARLRKHFNA